METKGFLDRRPVGRETKVYPSKKSKALDAKIKEAWLNLHKRYSSILGKEADELTGTVYDAVKKLSK
jgi:hypothetical protein